MAISGLCVLCTVLLVVHASSSTKSFSIDRVNKRFLLDARPFQYISGSIHYFRVHPQQWNDRLSRMRAAGLNAIQLYIPWNFHELYPGMTRFDGIRNITHFLSLAAQNELFALVRLGPYSCGEWENGGLPWWLLNYEDIRMRTSDQRSYEIGCELLNPSNYERFGCREAIDGSGFLGAVKRWFDVLLRELRPSLYKNGGNVLMLQLENEYGSFPEGCDRNYTTFLRDLTIAHYGDDVVLYTTDGNEDSYLKCGAIPGVFATVDFQPGTKEHIDSSFAAQRRYAPDGPLVNSEYYPGWLVLWADKRKGEPPLPLIVNGSQYMFKLGASFNYYMFYGGTNFGFWNGAEPTSAVITSYDYFAPLTEAADANEKFVAIRDWIKTIKGWPNPPKSIPKDHPKAAYGKVRMRRAASLVSRETLLHLAKGQSIRSPNPISFEHLNHPFGFVAYASKLPKSGGNLTIPVIKDHGFVFVGQDYQGMLLDSLQSRQIRWIAIDGQAGDKLTIIIENRGRQTYETINDFKGIISSVMLDGVEIRDWDHYPLHLPNAFDVMEDPLALTLPQQRVSEDTYGKPGVYVGQFAAKLLQDTYLDPTGWGKGQLIVNGFNVGRYWPSMGPQVTLYVPAPVMRKLNTVVMIELVGAPQCTSSNCSAEFIDHPVFNFTSTN